MAIRKSQTRNQLIALVMLIAVLAIAWVVLWPAFKDYKDAKAGLTATQIKLIEKNVTLDQMDLLMSNYEGEEARLADLKEALPTTPSVPDLIADLEELVFLNTMSISKLSVTEVVDPTGGAEPKSSQDEIIQEDPSGAFVKPKLVTLKIDLAVVGTADRFANFLESIEKNLRLLEVKILNIEIGDGEEIPMFDMVIETYYQKQ